MNQVRARQTKDMLSRKFTYYYVLNRGSRGNLETARTFLTSQTLGRDRVRPLGAPFAGQKKKKKRRVRERERERKTSSVGARCFDQSQKGAGVCEPETLDKSVGRP